MYDGSPSETDPYDDQVTHYNMKNHIPNAKNMCPIIAM